MKTPLILSILAALLTIPAATRAQGAITPMMQPSPDALTIVQNGLTTASIVLLPDTIAPIQPIKRGAARLPDPFALERQAGEDLARFIEMMSGAKPNLVLGEIPANAPAIVLGRAALAAEPDLQKMLDGVAKKNPLIRADAIAMKRAGNRVYLAGTNPEATYYAAMQLLQDWGCRWYLPTEFGEVVPEKKTLLVGALNKAYAPPFELRHYWTAWRGSTLGADEFKRRNFMAPNLNMVGMGHALKKYILEIIPPGKSHYNVSLSDPKTARHIASKIEADYAKGVSVSLAMEDGNFSGDSPDDLALITEWDKYALRPSYTDAMLTLYNNVGKILREKYPDSQAKIGGMAYNNVTLPPRIVKNLEPNVVMWIAPIDIDPIHGMDDPKSPPRGEYKEMMYQWAKLTNGKLAIYDYDQSMLVWRDLPIPSHTAFAQDVKHYRAAGIVGIGTESRGALATTFTNFYIRGQLMWNPDQDVKALLTDFYSNFYGPTSAPMAAYWNAISDAWDSSLVTEHEYMLAPAIYTPELIALLRENLESAEQIVAPLKGKAELSRNEKLYLDRVAFTRLSFNVIEKYMAMTRAAASEADYQIAAELADEGLAARDALTAMSPIFTTALLEKPNPMWWKGEPGFMRELLAYADGTKGTLVGKTPLQWAWKSESSLPANWKYNGLEGGVPKESTPATQAATEANGWKGLRTDIYLQGQGILNPDGQSYTGTYWYQTTLDLTADQTGGKIHLMFPGLFNETWLYVNGELAAHRDLKEPWWQSDYRFTWDAAISGKLRPGKNIIALRGFNPHHFGGIFRRPFLYRPALAPN